MSLVSLNDGAGRVFTDDGNRASGAIRELQGLSYALLTGASANTKINVSAIRTEDTVLMALNNNAGTITDLTSTISIVDLRATGTVTAASVTAADTVTVNGAVFTAIANGATPSSYKQFSVGASDTACATNLAAAINAQQAAPAVTQVVTASSNAAVVTITAVAEGTGGNSLTLATSDNTRLAKSGTTLSGGSATGGIKSTSASNQIVLLWFNRVA